MNNRSLSLWLCALLMLPAAAQTSDNYTEPKDPHAAIASEWKQVSKTPNVSWASRDVHYAMHKVPLTMLTSDTTLYAWRGERISAEAVIFAKNKTGMLRLTLSDWTKDGKKVLDANSGTATFMNYVITDKKRDCGKNDRTTEAFLVPDIIDKATEKVVEAKTTRPVWCTFEVPRTLEAGTYDVTLTVTDVSSNKPAGELKLKIVVDKRTMPEASESTFHVDFWQQPYAVSRWYNTGRWTQAHFNALRPYLAQLARSGQRVVSTILFYEPWGDQSYDKFDPMIKTTKKSDGSWAYDYSVFDHYVELCDSVGINGQINCYSMVPWDMTFNYFDEAQGREVSLKTTTSSTEYSDLWTPFLKAFAAHLKEKGWYDKTCIAMDERGLQDMLNAYNIVQQAVPGMKMALAGNYHKELVDKIYDYCIAYGQSFTDDDLKLRNSKRYVSTCYTSCADADPNIFTNSDPFDAAFLPLYSLSKGMNGYLHWSWMNWDDHPLTDSRYRLFPAGDTYSVYPGNRASVRYERFIEGVQTAEKYNMLKAEYTKDHQLGMLKILEDALDVCRDGRASADRVNAIENLVNGVNEENISPLAHTKIYQGYQTTGRGNKNSVLLKLQIPTVNKETTIQSLSLTLKGATRENIDNIKAYTSTLPDFPADAHPTLVGSTKPTSDDVTLILNNVEASSSPFYLYITVDVKADATLGAMLDAKLNSIDVEGRTVTLNADPDYAQKVYAVQRFLGMPNTYGSKIYRIPAMVVAKDGSIITAYDKRFDSWGDAGSHRIDLVVRRSTDNGKTWSEPLTIAEGTGKGGFSNGYGDPALVVTSKGRVICISCAGDKGFGQGQKDVAMIYSDDNGKTWSEPINITDYHLDNKVDGKRNMLGSHGFFVTSGRGIVTKSGRIAFAANYRLANGRINEYVFYSDNEGKTWTLDNHLGYGGADESKLVELNDGRLMMSIRQHGKRGFNVTTEKNSLLWGKQWRSDDIKGTACNADILYYNRDRSGKNDILLHTIPATIPTLQRANLLLYISKDGGKSWTAVDTLQAGAASYSTMDRLTDGSLAIFYEDESNGVNNWTMNFITLTKEQVEAMAKEVTTPASKK